MPLLHLRPVIGLVAIAFHAAAVQADERISTDVFTVIDGDTIEAVGVRMELAGIDAPEPGWRCTLSGTERDCGIIARSSLLDLTAGTRIDCRPAPTPSQPQAYRCVAGGYDLSEGMVYTGWAVPLPGAPEVYMRVLEDARARPRGFWRGSFTETWPALDAILVHL